MKIVIDARLINQTGVGRYIRNLVSELGLQDKTNKYVLIINSQDYEAVKLPNSRWITRKVDIRWHSLAEQLEMPGILASEKPDLVHIPYFNIPILYFGPMVVTIHDLIIDHFDTGKASTLPGWKYALRRLSYKIVMWIGLRKAKRILTVSETTKKELMEHYALPKEKIVVTYEGVDRNLGKRKKEKGKRLIEKEYFLYVGNAYPHKNLETLLYAFKKLTVDSGQFVAKFVLVGKKDLFYERIEQRVKELGLLDFVVFFGAASDEQLISLYDHAITLVCPSLMEGFGLPPLEALARGCPVICSDIPVFREILKDAPIYFPPGDIQKFATALESAITQPQKVSLIESEIRDSYSWVHLAKVTLDIYSNTRGNAF